MPMTTSAGIAHVASEDQKRRDTLQISQPKVGGLTEYSTFPSAASHTPVTSYKSVPASLLLPDGTPDYLRLILTSRVYDVIKETPVTAAISLSAKIGVNVLLKREDLQPVFSFKLRGAYNKIAQLPEEDRWKGVVACSAGNHAQGVAYSAKHLGIPATIVMPVATPTIKHSNVSRMGSKVVLHGEDFDAAKAECDRLQKKYGLTNIPPFDDPYVIAGQGTIGMELLRQIDVHSLEAVLVPVGGGGLIAGISAYIKRIAPHVKIIGVETFDADALYQSLMQQKRVMLTDVGLFADGAAVKMVGEETFRLCSGFVDEVVRVTTDELCAAMKDIFEDTRSVVEPTGALAVAGLKRYIAAHPDISKKGAFCAIMSGANMNFDRLRFVAERAQLGEGREVFLMVTIPEKPGSFRLLLDVIYPRGITEFSYRFSGGVDAYIYISFTVDNRDIEVPAILEELSGKGMKGVDISDNELAKSHARYLVGGKAKVDNERIYRFEFPERPGALKKFLDGLKIGWNITLFHYRNHGSDLGQVLAAISVPPKEYSELQIFLQDLGYPSVDETENIVYQSFIRA
ncbi:tryptophan synthase beta subunit-like PLP-dependent enzyme [Lipomyces tetrasporus]|uniref:Threonine dehydratase n=1 Tax=Lipomyces tetrasporus TaxID=54092 RepID=A0AAD7QMD8_9ASCO|nr:tryptophan synthase beta subunit-like PLP-dependent enzyme [Lipomyces tetrasporus]KAJ8097844.1 tryptophan synthase beta subunit-like PLP-dependent enzyme [Lipomyces tetrasporus]